MKRNLSFLIISVMIVFGACKKSFLDVPDKTTILRQAYVVDLKTAGDYLNGVYVELTGSFYGGYSVLYPELVADNIKPIIGGSFLVNHYKWQQLSTDDDQVAFVNGINVNGVWYSGYRIIRDCSFLIEELDKYRAENPAKADNMKGQAFAIRAFAHFFLVNMFAQSYSYTAGGTHMGIPYITVSDWAQPVSRQSVADVYTNMINDLNSAIGLLPAVSSSTVLFSSNAAKALLARIYLFKEDYSAAKNFAREVGTTVPIMTGANYPGKLFTTQETEALFQIPPAYTGVTSGGGNFAPYTYSPGVYLAAPLLQFNATADIATILKENPQDVRKAWVTQIGTTIPAVWNGSKFPLLPSGSGFPANTFHYTTVFRSSEMYLTAAEAYAKLNNNDSAYFYLDAIRKRANPSAPTTIATGPALLDSIYKERRKELAFEGLRMFDLLRWKKGVNRLDANFVTAQTLSYPNDKAICPIPVQDVKLSGLPQNPSY